MRRYQTKTGFELTVLNGQGLGDGIPCGNLSLVKSHATGEMSREAEYIAKRQERGENLMSDENLSQWEAWIIETFGDESA